MPFVLKHKKTSEIVTCQLINNYDIPFYGTKFWEDPLEADREAKAFLEGTQSQFMEDWQLIEVEEHQLKLFNVKLNNNRARRLFLDEQGKVTVITQDLKSDPDAAL